MKISFVIPAHNEERLIGECLKSVFAEIDRVHDSGARLEAEVVVVDNASSDRTREEALKFPNVTVVRENLKGLVYARRAGWVATTGELVANIDADVELPQGWLTLVLQEFAADEELVALSGPHDFIDLPLWKRFLARGFYLVGWVVHLFNHHVMGKGAMLQGGNFILRRDAWERAGGFDTTISFYGEDTDVAVRIARQGRVLWTWALPVYASSRRLRTEGILKMSWVYALNHLSILWRGKPATHDYSDIRIKE